MAPNGQPTAAPVQNANAPETEGSPAVAATSQMTSLTAALEKKTKQGDCNQQSSCGSSAEGWPDKGDEGDEGDHENKEKEEVFDWTKSIGKPAVNCGIRFCNVIRYTI